MTGANQTITEFGAKRPKVSVVMAIHNEEEYGPTAIQSILDQTFTDFEFIIIDDASTDSTPQMLRDFAIRDKRIRILTNEENLSVPRSLNIGLEAANGEYIARMDSDDYSYPHRFADQVAFLDANPDYVIVGGGVEYIGNDGKVFRTFDRGSNWWEFEWVSFFRPPLAHPCAVFRADAVRKHELYYDSEFDRAEDFEFWHRLIRYGKGCELEGTFIQYRVHDGNVSTKHARKQSGSANRAGKKNAIAKFPNIAKSDVDELFDFLHSLGNTTSVQLSAIVRTLEGMQSTYAREKNLSPQQIRDVRRKTAKLLIKNSINRRLHRRSETISEFLNLVARYLPDYCAEAFTIANRRRKRANAA